MSLADAAVRIRPRGSWEGLDLGFAMARCWLVRLWVLWWIPVVPLTLLLVLVFGADSPVTYILLWWAKPLYEWALVHWLSQKVFATHLSINETMAIYRPVRLRALWPYLLWRRFTLHRSFTMPIGMLEGLRGQARAARADVLARGQGAVVWLMIVCVHFEMVLNVGLYMALVFFADNEYARNGFMDQFMYFSDGLPWLSLSVLLLTWSVLAPFYVAAGFAAYLTRRTELEAWDLELVFRNLGPRLREAGQARTAAASRAGAGSALVALFLCGALGLGAITLPGPLWAQESGVGEPVVVTVTSPEEAQELIAAVLEEDAFGEKTTISTWRYRGDEEESIEDPEQSRFFQDLGSFLGLSIQWFFWLALFALLIWGGYYLAGAMGWLQPRERRGEDQLPELDSPLAETAPLPDDIPAAVAALLHAERLREALALLYRASLARLTVSGGFEVAESATEGECRRLVRRHCPRITSRYFDGLTRAWMQAAYGLSPPERAAVEQLHQMWPRIFREVRHA